MAIRTDSSGFTYDERFTTAVLAKVDNFDFTAKTITLDMISEEIDYDESTAAGRREGDDAIEAQLTQFREDSLHIEDGLTLFLFRRLQEGDEGIPHESFWRGQRIDDKDAVNVAELQSVVDYLIATGATQAEIDAAQHALQAADPDGTTGTAAGIGDDDDK